jgi:phosphoribosylglycinamide formyltransferase, formyltetrahydrofolate-dependent
MNTPLRIAVLASGRGSNLAALIAARDTGSLPVEFVLVASDKASAGALRLAEAAGIPTLALNPKSYPDRPTFDRELFGRIAASGAELLVLAGFMRVIDGAALAPWAGRIVNIHPSLLPKYRGLHTHRRALEAGDTEHGASVHFVTAELDGGPLIAQARLAIEPGDDEETLARRLLPLEHRLLPAVVTLIAARRLALGEAGVLLDGQPLRAPLQLGEDRLQ